MISALNINKTNKATLHALYAAYSSTTPKYRNMTYEYTLNHLLIIFTFI